MDPGNATPPEGGRPPGQRGEARREPTAVWAYAITGSDASDLAPGLDRLTGVGGAPVRAAGCSRLSMVVSDVSEEQFGADALRRNLENLDWLDAVAHAHHRVIDAAARLVPLLPARLATVYSGDAAVCAALTERRAVLRGALRRLGGRVEWGVKAYAVPEPETTAGAPGGGDGREQDGPDADEAAPGPGQRPGAGLAYLRRRRAQLTAGQQSRAAAIDAAREVHDALAGRAERARLHPPQLPQLSGVRLPMLLNAAYLLPAAASTDFNAAVAAQAAAHPGLRVELTGPWPPYSFAADDDDDER